MVKVIKIGEEDEETDIADNVTTQEPVIEEELTTELDDYKIKQKFVKRVYYSIILLIYFTFCYYLALDIMLNYANEEYSLSLLILYILILSILFPIAILSLGLFSSGGILLGPMVAMTYGLMSLISRFIIKIVGLDVELIFPELVGHTGVVSKPNVLGKFTTYNLSVEIEKAGLYGNSFWHGNNIAAKSKVDEIPVGTKVRVIEADYWSLSSLLRNSPVIVVVPDEEDIDSSLDDGALDHEEVKPEVGENEVDTMKVNKGMGLKSAANWTVRLILLLTGILFIFLALMVLSTCGLSDPPVCGTLMDAAPCFSVSIICFILYFYLGRVE